MAMEPFPRWAHLHPDLLCSIGDRLDDLKSYASARGACTAWRRALAPPSPTLLVAVTDANDRWRWRPYAACLRTRRCFELAAVASGGSRCVGASNDGWLALSLGRARGQDGLAFVLFNPVAAAEIRLPPLVYEGSHWCVSKVVFAPGPAKDDFAAAMICDNDAVAYVTAGARRWAVVDVGLTGGDHLIDVVYTDEGHKVYCLTNCGNVYVLRLPERRRREPAANVDEARPLEPVKISILHQPPQPADEAELTINLQSPPRWQHHQRSFQMTFYGEEQAQTIIDEDATSSVQFSDDFPFYEEVPLPPEPHHLNAPATVEPLLSEPAEISVLHMPPQPADEAELTINLQSPPRWQHHQHSFQMAFYEEQAQTTSFLWGNKDAETFIPFYEEVPPEPQEPHHLNAPATVEPLLSEANLPFNPARVFAPPYGVVASFTSAKNLVFCEGNLYQVWRNESCTVTLRLRGGGRRRVAENEILVLRYYPQRQPCWDVVKDLGGHSLFVGRNNAVSMYAKGVPGLRGNCVYWIGGCGRDLGMVFDVESGRSTPCAVSFLPQQPHSTICWYFLSRCM